MATSDCTTVYIYALIDPETDEIRYIGKTIRPQERFRAHLRDTGNSHKANWIKQLRERQLKPIMYVLEETTIEVWEAREQHWIAYGHSQGWRLTNLVAGGRGNSNPSDETRERQRISHLGKKRTPESIAKQALAQRGIKMSEAHKQKMRDRPHTWAHKISAGKMGHRHSDTAKSNMSAARVAYYDRVGRSEDRVRKHLYEHPEDSALSCRKLGEKLGLSHAQVGQAKRDLGYPTKQYRYNKRPA